MGSSWKYSFLMNASHRILSSVSMTLNFCKSILPPLSWSTQVDACLGKTKKRCDSRKLDFGSGKPNFSMQNWLETLLYFAGIANFQLGASLLWENRLNRIQCWRMYSNIRIYNIRTKNRFEYQVSLQTLIIKMPFWFDRVRIFESGYSNPDSQRSSFASLTFETRCDSPCQWDSLCTRRFCSSRLQSVPCKLSVP